MEISLHFLIDTFRLSIELRMVSGGEGEVVIQEFSKFSGKGRCKLGTTIIDNLVVESTVKKDFVEEEEGNALSGDGFLSGAENYPLITSMVYHNQ